MLEYVKSVQTRYSLIDQQRSWPLGIASIPYSYRLPLTYKFTTRSYSGQGMRWCTSLYNGRFAFIFATYCGDQRKLLDTKMLRRNEIECSPFANIAKIEDFICFVHKSYWRFHRYWSFFFAQYFNKKMLWSKTYIKTFICTHGWRRHILHLKQLLMLDLAAIDSWS